MYLRLPAMPRSTLSCTFFIEANISTSWSLIFGDSSTADDTTLEPSRIRMKRSSLLPFIANCTRSPTVRREIFCSGEHSLVAFLFRFPHPLRRDRRQRRRGRGRRGFHGCWFRFRCRPQAETPSLPRPRFPPRARPRTARLLPRIRVFGSASAACPVVAILSSVSRTCCTCDGISTGFEVSACSTLADALARSVASSNCTDSAECSCAISSSADSGMAGLSSSAGIRRGRRLCRKYSSTSPGLPGSEHTCAARCLVPIRRGSSARLHRTAA